MKRALLFGESWMTHMTHQKGFDSFTTTEYVEGGQEYLEALRAAGWDAVHVPAHSIAAQFTPSSEYLTEFDLVVISDVGANSFLLTPNVFNLSVSEPNRLALIRDYVLAGGGLLMVGGYLSFSGVDAKAAYAASPLGEILPVQTLFVDDRAEHPEGVMPVVLHEDHPALGGVGAQWPRLLGFNRTGRRDGADVLVEIDGFPLVAVGTAGEGRVGAFTSDMSPHWAPPPFMAWEGYAALWQGLSGWVAALEDPLLPHVNTSGEVDSLPQLRTSA